MPTPFVSLEGIVEKLKGIGLSNQFTWNAIWKAITTHTEPRFSGKSYYEEHLFSVTAHAMDYLTGVDHTVTQEVVAASLLHDVLEDSMMTDDEFKEQFGELVYSFVQPLTYPTGREIGNIINDRDFPLKREILYYDKLTKALIESKVIKLADRYNNMSCLTENGPRVERLKRRYVQEADEFYLEFARGVDQYFGNLTYWHDLIRQKTEELRVQIVTTDVIPPKYPNSL